MISFVVPGEPIPQPRMQVSGFHRWYKPPKGCRVHPIVAYKQQVAAAARAVLAAPLLGPIAVQLVFKLPRPSRLVWKTKPMPAIPAPVLPDGDNLEKAIWDSLKGIAWRDDGQICKWSGEKWYHAGDEQPCVEVRIEEINEANA